MIPLMMFILEIRVFEKKYGYDALNRNGFKDLELYEQKLKDYLGMAEKDEIKETDKKLEDEEENVGLVGEGEFEVIEEVDGEEGSLLWENEHKKSEEILL